MALFRSSKVIRDLLTAIGADVDDVEEALTIEPLASVFMTAVTADTDILTADLVPGEDCLLMVQASFSLIGAFYYLKTLGGVSTPQIQFNDGLDLYGDNGYMFDVTLTADIGINFQYSQTCTCNELDVFKVYIR